MANTLPAIATVWQAIEIYLQDAWPDGPSARISAILDTLRTLNGADFYQHPHWERDTERSTRLALRLGNARYPHMKFVIEEAPSGGDCLFRADGHDAHIEQCVGCDEAEAFRSLVSVNRVLSSSIEAAWDAAGIPTFKRFLREDIARRRALRPAASG